MATTFLHKKGEYPKLENSENLVKLSGNSPASLFSINTSSDYKYPVLSGLSLITLKNPTPDSLYAINKNSSYPYPTLPNLNLIYLKEPTPYSLYYTKKPAIKYPVLPNLNLIKIGAFNKAANLTSVTIAKSVKTIGEVAFADTALTEITIADDCNIQNTSIPPECKLNRK